MSTAGYINRPAVPTTATTTRTSDRTEISDADADADADTSLSTTIVILVSAVLVWGLGFVLYRWYARQRRRKKPGADGAGVAPGVGRGLSRRFSRRPVPMTDNPL